MVTRYSTHPLRQSGFCLVLMIASSAALAELTASVNRTELSGQEALVYTLRSDGSSAGTLDLTPLQKDFFVLGSSRSNQIRIINGKNESWTEWNITLQPRRDGLVTIPALTYNNSSSEPITITVSEQAVVADKDLPVMMQSSINMDELWEGQEALLTLNILSRGNFASNPDLSAPAADGVIFKLLNNEQSAEQIINGYRYQTIALTYLVTPTRTGELTIPGQVLTGSFLQEDPYSSYSRLSMGRPQPFRITSPDITITVKAPPASWPANTPWLPADSLAMVEHWSSDPTELKTGDSITRTVTVSATGINSAQIPPLPPLRLTGLNSYPDQPKTTNNQNGSINIATRSESVALVPTQSGEITLPAIKITWFNTKTNTIEIAELAAQTLVVAQGEVTPIQQPTVQPSLMTAVNPAGDMTTTGLTTSYAGEDATPWKIATLIFALLWLCTLIYALFGKGRAAQTTALTPAKTKPRESALFKQLTEACNKQALAKVEESLVLWGEALYDVPGQTISDILRQLDYQPLTEAWLSLLQNRYSATPGNIDTQQLSPLLMAARKQWLNQAKGIKKEEPLINPV